MLPLSGVPKPLLMVLMSVGTSMAIAIARRTFLSLKGGLVVSSFRFRGPPDGADRVLYRVSAASWLSALTPPPRYMMSTWPPSSAFWMAWALVNICQVTLGVTGWPAQECGLA